MKTPPEVLAIAEAIRKGKPLPVWAVVDAGVYAPKESIWARFVNWLKPKKSCGCKARKKRLNAIIPGLGTFVELLTTYTGIKRLIEWWYPQGAENLK